MLQNTIQQPPLSSQASRLRQSPNFRAWFGASKVVDADGLPMAQFHGTLADFRVFRHTDDIGFHFGSPDAASLRLSQISEGEKCLLSGCRLVPVFLCIENPLRMRDHHTWASRSILSELIDLGLVDELEEEKFDFLTVHELKSILARKGHDGIVYANETEGGGDSYVVFDAWRIKSVLGNCGAFDPRNNSIFA